LGPSQGTILVITGLS